MNLPESLEQPYRDILVFPLLKACVNILGNDDLLFIPGEVPLNSVTAQLANLKKTLAPNEKYYADGIVSYLNILYRPYLVMVSCTTIIHITCLFHSY
jgi:hypothetical protein